MSVPWVSQIPLARLGLLENWKQKRSLLSFELEITARCNNNCRHCYINLPDADKNAIREEMSLDEIRKVVDEAVSLGALWCLITGGEPLLREDFVEIYLYLKRQGLLVSVFTNATLIGKDHVTLFRQYPPRDLEVTVYGITRATYERITRNPGSFDAFQRGLDLLRHGGIPVRLKTMALRSNRHEIHSIISFCRQMSQRPSRFDPFLHLRYDGNPQKNTRIQSERLLPEEVVRLESQDPDRMMALRTMCDGKIAPAPSLGDPSTLFRCGAGLQSFSVSFRGDFRLCSSLCDPQCVYDLKSGTLTDAWDNFAPRWREMRSSRQGFLETCAMCPLVNLCFWCPAHAYLEVGALDAPVPYFCEVARLRTQLVSKEETHSPEMPGLYPGQELSHNDSPEQDPFPMEGG